LEPGVDRPENGIDPVLLGQIANQMKWPDCFERGADKSLAAADRVLEH
jgi:hypothetical protein